MIDIGKEINFRMDLLENLNGKLLDSYLRAVRKAGLNAIGELQYNPQGEINADVQNKIRVLAYQKQLEELSLQFVRDNFADEVYRREWLAGHPEDAPDTLNGRYAEYAAKLAQYGVGYKGVDDRFVIAQNLNEAIDGVSTANNRLRNDIMRTFNDYVRRGQSPGDLTKWLTSQDEYQGRDNVAATITRGTFMGTYRGYSQEQGKRLEKSEDFQGYELMGPPPFDPNDAKFKGHWLCWEHFGEIHTMDEWQELAEENPDDYGGDVNPGLWCGGYNCRHSLRASMKQVTKAENDAAEAELDKLAEELGEWE